jgi:hypothetical protein
MVCPKCQGEVWDNRQKKAAGTFKANAPDFACKKKDGCGWNSYPPKEGQTTPPATLPVGNGSDDQRVVLFWDSFDSVLTGIRERKLTDMFNPEHICTLTATLFISRSRN